MLNITWPKIKMKTKCLWSEDIIYNDKQNIFLPKISNIVKLLNVNIYILAVRKKRGVGVHQEKFLWISPYNNKNSILKNIIKWIITEDFASKRDSTVCWVIKKKVVTTKLCCTNTLGQGQQPCNGNIDFDGWRIK